MTDKQHPALFDWATELLDAEGHVTLSAKEAHEIGARLRSMGEKLKAYEDLDEAASDVQLLRMGYAAARLEIESLQARIKTMAEEHADELMVAHMDGRMRAAQPAGAQQPTTQAAPQQEAQEPVAWYVTGCGRLLDEDEAKANLFETRIFYTAPQPTQAQAGAVPLTCEWAHNEDDGFWDTECGQSWRFDDGGPKENHMNFCHCCGKPLRIKGGQHGAE